MNKLILTAIALRAGLLLFGTWQDTHLAVKYTDIDYEVYTDAAQFMVQGGSPYQRSTYRYSPLLAALLTPNILVHRSFGKVLFALADIIAALVLQRLIKRRFSRKTTKTTTVTGEKLNNKFSFTPQTTTTLALALWLFSPFTVSISTRGNGEALVTCMLLGMLDLLETNHIIASGVLYGFAVHWRVYPIIYALPILKYLAVRSNNKSSGGSNTRSRRSAPARTTSTSTHSRDSSGNTASIQHIIHSLFSLDGFKFGLAAAFIFLALGIGLYYMYGSEFLHETYLYHATRIDPRHNFSPYYYPAYLGTEKTGINPTGGVVSKIFEKIGDSGKIWTFATLLLQVSLGWAFAETLENAFFLQTVAFVAFNKVATAQYFVWYFSWLPLVLPTLLQAPNKKQILLTTLLWAASLGHWLAWAYQLEFAGNPVHLSVWCAGLVWVISNAALLRELVHALK